MFFESKWKIFKLIPEQYFPTTIFIDENDSMEIMQTKIQNAGIHFPLIAKPDRGERGWMVRKIEDISELFEYRVKAKIDFLIQSFIDNPLEFSVFYFRHPQKTDGIITSITLKNLLSVKGDGTSTIGELMKKSNRSFLQFEKLKQNLNINMNEILPLGVERQLVPYGNHVLGAMFSNYNHIIDETLRNTFDKISKQINGFYFGRFDLRCNSIEDLKTGTNISILELNGAAAEPAHIYDPGFSYIKAQFVLGRHFKMMYEASKENQKNGAKLMTFETFKRTRYLEKQYRQKVKL